MRFAKRMLGNMLLVCSLVVCLYGLVGTYVLCVYVVEEWTNGTHLISQFAPDVSSAVRFWISLPALFVGTLQYFMTSSFVTFVFSPLILPIVPPLAGLMYGDWAAVLFGWLPFVAGIALFVAGGLLRAQGEDASGNAHGRRRRKRNKQE